MEDLKNAIIADGKVDAQEVEQLKAALYADGKIDADEVKVLFEINDAVTGNDNDPAYEELFVKAVCDFCLEDDNTPGVVDEDEANLIISLVEGDGQIDELEKKTLLAIGEKATEIKSEKLKAIIDTLK